MSSSNSSNHRDNNSNDDDDSSERQTSDRKKRGSYYCSKCGKLKKGHKCKAFENTVTFSNSKEDSSFDNYGSYTVEELHQMIKDLKNENSLLKKQVQQLQWNLDILSNQHKSMFQDHMESEEYYKASKRNINIYEQNLDVDANRIVLPQNFHTHQYNVNTIYPQGNLSIKSFMYQGSPNHNDSAIRNNNYYNDKHPKARKDKDSHSDMNYDYNYYDSSCQW